MKNVIQVSLYCSASACNYLQHPFKMSRNQDSLHGATDNSSNLPPEVTREPQTYKHIEVWFCSGGCSVSKLNLSNFSELLYVLTFINMILNNKGFIWTISL